MRYHKETVKNVYRTSKWSTFFSSCAEVIFITCVPGILIRVVDKHSENVFFGGIRPFLWRCNAPAATALNLRVTVAGNRDSCTSIHADTLALRFSPPMTSCDKLNFKWFCVQRIGRSCVTWGGGAVVLGPHVVEHTLDIFGGLASLILNWVKAKGVVQFRFKRGVAGRCELTVSYQVL